MENREVPLANNFGFEVKQSDKSLIYIRKNNGSIMDLWGTPTSTLVQGERCPFKATLVSTLIDCEIFIFCEKLELFVID